MNTINIRAVLLFFLLISLPILSSAKIKNADGETSIDPWLDFRNGDARLTCNVACSVKDGNQLRKYRKAYKEERWEDLVDLVINSGHAINRNYFYLAVSAENLSLLEPALTYYRLAKTESLRCVPILGTCHGIKVRAEAKEKIDLVKEKLASKAVSESDNLVENGQPKEQQLNIIDTPDSQKIDSTPTTPAVKTEPAILAFEGKGKWDVNIQTDPITDEKIVVSTLKSNDFKPTYKGLTALLIRCDNRKVEIFTSFDDYLGSKSIAVISRVDKDKPETKKWSLSTNSQSAFYPSNEKELLRRLFAAEQFVVRATPYNESPKTLIFDVKGIYNTLKPHQDTCDW